MLSKRINTGMADIKKQGNGHNSDTNDVDKKRNQEDVHKDKFQLARRNTIKTLLIVGLCFIICWSQNEFFYLMYNFGYPLDWNSAYYNFTVLMVFLNSTVNPFMYLIKYQDYQIALRQFLRCKTKNTEENQSQNSISGTSNQISFSNI